MSKLGIRGFANLLPSFMTPLRKNQKVKRHVICVLQTFSINFKYNVYRLVLFVGGYTMAEVAAFRWLQAATGFFYQIKLILGLLKLDQKQFLVTLTFVSG